jgi:glutaminase
MLQSFGVLDGDPDEVLGVYFRQCSFNVTSTDLARMAATLARGGVNPMTGRRVTDTVVVQRTLAVMVTCGMYDAAGDWVSAVGMPAKSGHRCWTIRETVFAEFGCAAACPNG